MSASLLSVTKLPELCLIKIITFLDSESIDNFLSYLKHVDEKLFTKIFIWLNHIIRNNIEIISIVENIHININEINTTKQFMYYYTVLFNKLRESEGKPKNKQSLICYKIIIEKLNEKDSISEKNKKKFHHILDKRYRLYFPYEKENYKYMTVRHDKLEFSLNFSILQDYITLEN